jgi:hypothetical protein
MNTLPQETSFDYIEGKLHGMELALQIINRRDVNNNSVRWLVREMDMKLANLVEEIETTLQQERKSYADGDETDENIKGWIEALEYVLRQIEVLH